MATIGIRVQREVPGKSSASGVLTYQGPGLALVRIGESAVDHKDTDDSQSVKDLWWQKRLD
jgi:hypothetical protein